MPEAREPRRAQLANPAFKRPGGVGRTACPIRKHETIGRARHRSTSILPGPQLQLEQDLGISHTGERLSARHDDQLPFGSHLKGKVRIFGAERCEVVIGHRRCIQRRGQECVGEHELYGLILASVNGGIPGFESTGNQVFHRRQRTALRSAVQSRCDQRIGSRL